MNRNQVIYQLGRIFYKASDAFFLGFSGLFVYDSIRHFSNVQSESDYGSIGSGVFNAILAIWIGVVAFQQGGCRYFLYEESKEINGNKEKYPLEHVDSIIFDDVTGLEKLLEKTRQNKFLEWGTYIKAHDEKEVAIIDEVLGFEDAKKTGLMGRGGVARLHLNTTKAEEEGYNGFHHCHINLGIGATNFTIAFTDRYKPENWINLLTFNLSGEPEIIGYNRQFVYIPRDKNNKQELVRATPSQIMEYLAT